MPEKCSDPYLVELIAQRENINDTGTENAL